MYLDPGVYRGPPEVYRGPCMKNMALNSPITYTSGPKDQASITPGRLHHVTIIGLQHIIYGNKHKMHIHKMSVSTVQWAH